MVVPAFGFSAGDFIAVVGVLRKTARALRDTGGAASQYQHTVLNLRSMRCALIRLQSLEPQNEDASVVEEIRKCSKACIIPLDKFLNSIANLDREFGRRERTWKKPFNQVKWALKLEPELRQLEASLDAEVQPLQMLLQLESRDSRVESDKNILETRDLVRHTSNLFEGFVTFFHDKAATTDLSVPMAAQLDKLSMEIPDFRQDLSTTMCKIQTGLNDLQKSQREFQRSLRSGATSTQSTSISFASLEYGHCIGSGLAIYGQKLGQIDAALLYLVLDALSEHSIRLAIVLICLLPTVQRLLSKSCWNLVRSPTWLLDNNIRLEDCLGRPMSLPFEHFRHWHLVYAKLEIVLKGTPGERKLKEKQFEIFGFGSSLDEDTWDARIYPGASATMSVPFDDETVEGICPSCKSPGLTLCKQEWRCCNQCMFRYRYIDKHVLDRQDADSSQHVGDDDAAGVSAASRRPASLDMRMFRRVHFTHYIQSSSEDDPIEELISPTAGWPSTPLATQVAEAADKQGMDGYSPDSSSSSFSTAQFHCIYEPCASQNEFFTRRTDLERHLGAIHHQPTRQLIDCEHPDCHRRGEYGFTRRDKMIEHMRDVHKANIPRLGEREMAGVNSSTSFVSHPKSIVDEIMQPSPVSPSQLRQTTSSSTNNNGTKNGV